MRGSTRKRARWAAPLLVVLALAACPYASGPGRQRECSSAACVGVGSAAAITAAAFATEAAATAGAVLASSPPGEGRLQVMWWGMGEVGSAEREFLVRFQRCACTLSRSVGYRMPGSDGSSAGKAT